MSLNYVEALVDEIALEGLDGITLQALWVRLSRRKNFNFYLDDKSKEFLWNVVKKLKNVEFFILPKARADLVLPENDNEVDNAEAAVQIHMKQLYPHCMVNVNGIKGSCPTFESRIAAPDIIYSYSALECHNKWGGRLVMVASQQTRSHALMGTCKLPFSDLQPNHYCILERIGRSRHYGVFTYGPGSIQDVIKEDPRSHFYIRKKFLGHNLITKQLQTIKIKKATSSCYLLHLSRFYVLMKSMTIIRQDKILSLLREAPEHFVEYDQMRTASGLNATAFKKLITSMHSKGLINSHARVTYRTVYPNASPCEWRRKNTGLEKTIRVVVLGCSEKEENQGEDDECPNSDDEDGDEGGSKGILTLTHRTLERTVMYQAYQAIEEAGPDGMSQAQVGKLLGLGRLDRRLTCRQLLKEGTVSVKMQDVGRQRVSKYFAVRLQMKDLKFEREKMRFVELVGDVKVLEKLLSRDMRNPNSVVRYLRDEAEELVGFITSETKEPPAEEEVLEPDIAAVMKAIEQPTDERQKSVLESSEDVDNPTEPEDPLNTSNTESKVLACDEDSLMTYRILRRINIVLGEVVKYRVIDDISKFHKLIQDEEKEEGYEYRVDRKSLYRLIGKLQREKCVKLFKAVIKSDDKRRTLTFVCSPEIDKDHPAIQCAIEQAKFRVFNIPEVKPSMTVKTKVSDPLLDQDSIILSVQEIQKLNKEANSDALDVKSLKRELGNRYGHCPKFVRMRLLHKLLFYLTRNYMGSSDIDQEEAALKLQTMGHKVPDDLPKVYYSNAVDWKMFIPPLPRHVGWPDGWTILCDVVLRIPLSVFVRIMWVRYVIPGLDSYMSHPIKQHYLLGNLPRFIRSNLLARRKFLYTLFETAQRLCFIGVLQFGPQRLKEKDQLFIYVNKRASIVDTTPSKVAYFQISTDINYEQKSYEFSNTHDVDRYWCDLFTTSVCTQLGGKIGQEGKEIVLENLENKPALLESSRAKTPAEALICDTGIIPGDHLGASGLDSAFFAHLKRNWCSKYLVYNSTQQVKNQGSALSSVVWEGDICNEPTLPLHVMGLEAKRTTEITVSKTTEKPEESSAPKPGPSGIKKKTTFLPPPKPGANRIKKRQIRKPRNRKKEGATQTEKHSPLRGRVSWSPEEDVYLILCKVAGIFLTQNSCKTAIKGPLVEHVLHKYIPSSNQKKSDQCLRRMNYLYNKSESAQLDIAMCLEESRQDPVIIERFLNLHNNIRARKLPQDSYEAAMDKGFEELVELLKQKYRSVPDEMILDTNIPDTLEEFHAVFNVVNPYLSLRQRGKYTEPTTLEQVYFNVIISLIFSSLGTSADKTNYSFQLLSVYQQYPDNWLRSAIHKLRTDQMVSSKKLFARSLRQKANQIPLTSTPFQLAMYYFHMMQSKYQYETFYEAWCAVQTFRKAGQQGLNMDLMPESGGRSACLFEGGCAEMVDMKVVIPLQIITLDFDVTIGENEKRKLLQAYENIIKNADKLENMQEGEVVNIAKTSVEDNTVEKQPAETEENVTSSAVVSGKRPRSDIEMTDSEVATSAVDLEETQPAKRPKLDDNVTSENDPFIIIQPCLTEQTNVSVDTGNNAPVIVSQTEEITLNKDPPQEKNNIISERQKAIQAVVASRMAFYDIRDELRDQRGIDESKDQRARLAMKPCEIFCSFKCDHLPIDELKLKKIINMLRHRNIVKGESSSWEEVQQKYMGSGASSLDLTTAAALVEFIKGGQQVGITIRVLREWYQTSGSEMSLAAHLNLLSSLQILLRAGVTTTHYIHWSFKQPWLINSAKLKRLNREKQVPLDIDTLDLGEEHTPCDDEIAEHSGKEVDVTSDQAKTDKLEQIKRAKQMKTTQPEPDVSEQIEVDESELTESAEPTDAEQCDSVRSQPMETTEPGQLESTELEQTQCTGVEEMETDDRHECQLNPSEVIAQKVKVTKRFGHSSKLVPPKPASAEEVAKQLEQMCGEKVLVAIRPWVRIDGSVNRRVLDRLLGAVLCHLLYNPGCTLKLLQQRFTPALLPYHTFELLEILWMIECVVVSVIKLPHKVTLFSKKAAPQIEPADMTEDEDVIFVEPVKDAILRMAQFIGDKTYASDFLEDIKIRPYTEAPSQMLVASESTSTTSASKTNKAS